MYGLWNRLTYMLSPQFDIYEQVSKVVFGTIIDIGCGTGFGTHLLTRNADSVVGYEIDEVALEFAKRAFSNGSITFRKGTVLDLKAADVDFVTMIDVIEHIKDDYGAIAGCKRLLNHEGRLICSTPNRLSRYRKSDHHVKEYSPGELIELLKSVFDTVRLVNYKLEDDVDDYTNPLIAICR